MQTLRKKTSPLKYKNETSRFLGEGVSFKAKLIGILEVAEARGDRMCQEALSDLKIAIRAAGEHKQRITINIAIDGLRLRDEKTGDSLYHHPVHKISFIAQDMSDSRAFGYIFGSPDTGHRFFGIKTDKAASQVVIAMRDLFQVVFALKKKEIELAKQHLDKSRYGSSPLFSERSLLTSKGGSQDATKSTTTDAKGVSGSSESRGSPAVADLVDLELELNSLQQGLTQMERITPSDPFGSKDDPFGDSFTTYPKPILPPPPSGRERANRISESSGSLFSPKTPHTTSGADSSSATDLFGGAGGHEPHTPKDYSFNEFNSSHDEPSSGDWFTPPAGNSLFEEAPQQQQPVLEPISKEQQHEAAKQEILSQFDVFTELDPLGTGKIKPYVDKKDFFQELKNPPKKVLNDLVPKLPAQEIFAATFETNGTVSGKSPSNMYGGDPFGEDPFDQTDPFADSDFSKQDVFDAEFNDFKLNNLSIDTRTTNNNNAAADLSQLFGLSKSPKNSFLDKQMSLPGTSPNQFDYKKNLSKLYENPSLDMSSESECAPDPPPRPASTLIKPPPLPPKKQLTELAVKPPPRRPPESHYDYMDKYETGYQTTTTEKEKSPPLPVPARKSKFESDFVAPAAAVDEEDYLTPVTFPTVKRNAGPILLPPPQKTNRKGKPHPPPADVAVTISSFLETKTNVATTTTSIPRLSLETLDITLSQLTLSGLNELATKLNIPASQLSNMTLVQLTNYLSNFIKNSETTTATTMAPSTDEPVDDFKADFADFNKFNGDEDGGNSKAPGGGYDRYAVFRELFQEEIKQTKIDGEPGEIVEAEKEEAIVVERDEPVVEPVVIDKYAALREIVEIELKNSVMEEVPEEKLEEEEDEEDEEEEEEPEQLETIDESMVVEQQNNINIDDRNNASDDLNDNDLTTSKEDIIEYSAPLDNVPKDVAVTPPTKSPVPKPAKSPVTIAITANNRLNSGSISDAVSGSSPEVDLTGSAEKKSSDAAGESWAIFDQPNLLQEAGKDAKAAQSEEGVSPWSSDSKEFGNGSPPEWRQRIDSGGGSGSGNGDRWGSGSRGARRDQGGWWDTSAEPEVQYYPANRRSTDSYEEECYECYDRPRRRRQTTWSGGGGGGQTAGGHSSSSRDVSPWEEEPRRRPDGRQTWSSRHARQHSFERHRRHTDSWDEEDDYDYEDEHPGRHWSDRHSSRESDRDRHVDDWEDNRRVVQHRRRREFDRERWCCPDYDAPEQEKVRYGSSRWPNSDRRKHDERYYSRDSQESPWEDEYGNEPDEPQPHYLTARRTRIRPSSASEMDRKTGEIKQRPGQYYFGGSDGERDRRYKSNRRSKSRDSQYSDSLHSRHKPDPVPASRNPHRPPKQYPKSSSQFENDFGPVEPIKKPPMDAAPPMKEPKKPSGGGGGVGVANRKKSKESPKTEEVKKTTQRTQSLFENDFVPSPAESPRVFTFENEFETSEAESPTVGRHGKARPKKAAAGSWFDTDPRRTKNAARYKQKSLFEDDFSPTERPDADDSIPSIKEERCSDAENAPDASVVVVSSSGTGRRRLSKIGHPTRDGNLKKSESVNIFARDADPFDDDFFSADANDAEAPMAAPSSRTELKWTDQFSDFDIQRSK